MPTVKGAVTVRGVEFEAQCAFDYTTRDEAPDYVPYGEGSVPMGGGVVVDDITPESVEPCESICIAARETLIQRGLPNNAKTRKRARFMAKQIMRDLDRIHAFRLFDEEEFTEEAVRDL